MALSINISVSQVTDSTPIPAPSYSYLLLEDGVSFILLEDNGKIILE